MPVTLQCCGFWLTSGWTYTPRFAGQECQGRTTRKEPAACAGAALKSVQTGRRGDGGGGRLFGGSAQKTRLVHVEEPMKFGGLSTTCDKPHSVHSQAHSVRMLKLKALTQQIKRALVSKLVGNHTISHGFLRSVTGFCSISLCCGEDQVCMHFNQLSSTECYKRVLNTLCETGKIGLIEQILEFADINGHDEHGRTPLLLAVENDHFEVVELLIRHGADVNLRRKTYHATALEVAIDGGNRDMVLMLLLAGAEIYGSCIYTQSVAMLKLLTDFGADIHQTDSHGYTLMSAAAECGYKDMVLHLIEKWVDPKYKHDTDDELDEGDDIGRFERRGNAIYVAEGETHSDLAQEMRLAIVARIRRRQAARVIRDLLAKNAQAARRGRNLMRALILSSHVPRLDSGVMGVLADCLEAQHRA